VLLKLLFLPSLIFSVVISVTAQTTYNFKHITTRDGLSDARITDFAQDKYGNIWMAGYGLNRYNGYQIEHYGADPNDSSTLPDMNVRHLFCSRKGNLYISTYNGFCRYDYLQNKFIKTPFGINARDSKLFEPEDGILWTNSTKGLVIINEKTGLVTELAKHPDTLVRELARLHIYDFAADQQQNIYLATRIGFFVINYKTWIVKHFVHKEDDTSSLANDDIQNIVIDRQGIVWLSAGYYGSSLERFDPTTEKVIHYNYFHANQEEWADNRILDLLIDSKDRLWISSVRSSLALYNRNNNSFDLFLHDPLNASSVASHSVNSMFEDKDGGIWLSVQESGADYFLPDNNSFRQLGMSSFQSPTMIDSWCQSLSEDKQGNLWIGTYRGLSFYNRRTRTFTNYLLAQQERQEANNSIRSLLVDDDGTVWIGTGSGLNRLDPGTKKISPVNAADSIPATFVNSITLDRKKNMWVCSRSGLFRYNRNTKKFENISKKYLFKDNRSNAIFSIYQDSKDRYWISLSLTGIMVYNESRNTVDFFDFKTLNPRSLPYDYITSFAEDANGVMWLSSFYGLIAFDYERNKITRYYDTDGLPSNKTSGLMTDSLNRLWIGTAQGLCMLDGDRKKFYRFDAKDGISSNNFYEGKAHRLSNGEFAYLTYGGIVLFDPRNVNISETKPDVTISSFKIAGSEFNNSVPVQEVKNIRLKHNQNFLQIELLGRNYADPKKIIYAYKLDGFNKDWIYTSERTISYTNIPGGKYIFRYKATNDPKNWNVPEQQLEIFIATVFYKTWWFISMIALVTAGIVYLLVRYRFAQQQKLHLLENKAQSLEKEKALVMYENLKQHLNPHFLFNSLTSLRSLIRVDQKNAGDFLERMSKIYRYILKSRESELVQLKDEINFVQTYIELQQTRFRKGLKVNFNINDEFLFRKIVPVTLQNLIDNAIKHNLVDEETPLIIDIYVEDDHLMVRNNLQKKEFVETSNKQGLQNMKSLYWYLDSRPMIIREDKNYFTIKIPLI
jgi:ligand-binding sensor domain-containing protein